MTFKMSEEAQTITVYNLRADTCEFIGAGDAWIPAHTGLPANCTDIEPPATKSGSLAVFDSGKGEWSIVEDHRGQTVYDTSTAEAIYISELGALPDNTTSVSPAVDYPKWNGSEWVQDADALKKGMQEKAESKRQELLSAANEAIADWRTELQLDVISEDDKANLVKWMAYIKALKALVFSNVTDKDSYESIKWPELP
ncbi:tail fiber assembly protein [Enterobacter cancerogenus]|uniref:tail fiber assembly protein n=1 Tax=Enterobacter cancerogenus TaxID=69218 RepID=UPI00384A7BAA